MKGLKTLAAAVALVWIISLIVLSLGGQALVANSDKAAEALVEASGVKQQLAMVEDERCRHAQLTYNKLWDRAVDESRMERMQDQLDRAKASVDAFCPNS